MAIDFVMELEVKREPAECTPGREPGWYVLDRNNIVAYCDTETEARNVVQRLHALASTGT